MTDSNHYTPTTKYVVSAKFEVQGVVEKPDVIGAIFGQTEGLFGQELDLRELQKSGRIGRIEITLDSKQDKTTGTITVPSSLDKVSTALIAAAIGSVDRIGPCDAKVVLDAVQDQRAEKRKVIMEKAKDILRKWVVEDQPSTDEILKEVHGAIKIVDVVSYGPERLPAGPGLSTSGSIIIVEGRADVINLLKIGIKNTIAIEGTKIPESVIQLCKSREVTAFLDGDHAGDLILQELKQVGELDYVTRAPPGKEVEDLTPKEIMKALRERLPADKARVDIGARAFEKPPTDAGAQVLEKPELPEMVLESAKLIRGTLEALLLDEAGKEQARMPVSELSEKLPQFDNVHTLVFDGVITQRTLDVAESKKVKYVIGDRLSEASKKPPNMKVMTMAAVFGQQ